MALYPTRQIAMIRAGVTNTDLLERWKEKFGKCSKSSVSAIVTGRMRSRSKELDFAEVVDVAWDKLFTPADVRDRDALPDIPEMLDGGG